MPVGEYGTYTQVLKRFELEMFIGFGFAFKKGSVNFCVVFSFHFFRKFVFFFKKVAFYGIPSKPRGNAQISEFWKMAFIKKMTFITTFQGPFTNDVTQSVFAC